MSKFLDKVRAAYDRKGYKFFEYDRPYNINLIGIRSAQKQAGYFDDVIGITYAEKFGTIIERWFPATTDPGSYYLTNPLNSRGTLILLEGQYIGAFKVGIHGRTWKGGGYQALEQRADMFYVRDNNLDDILDFQNVDQSKIISGNFKTNLHRAHKYKILEKIFRYSAGCTVLQDAKDLEFILEACNKSLEYYGNSFTYTLLVDSDLL